MVVYVTKYVNAVVHTHRQLTQDRTGNIQWLVEDQLMSMHPYQHQEVHSLSNHMDYSVKKQKGKKTLKFLELIFFGFMKKKLYLFYRMRSSGGSITLSQFKMLRNFRFQSSNGIIL